MVENTVIIFLTLENFTIHIYSASHTCMSIGHAMHGRKHTSVFHVSNLRTDSFNILAQPDLYGFDIRLHAHGPHCHTIYIFSASHTCMVSPPHYAWSETPFNFVSSAQTCTDLAPHYMHMINTPHCHHVSNLRTLQFIFLVHPTLNGLDTPFIICMVGNTPHLSVVMFLLKTNRFYFSSAQTCMD